MKKKVKKGKTEPKLFDQWEFEQTERLEQKVIYEDVRIKCLKLSWEFITSAAIEAARRSIHVKGDIPDNAELDCDSNVLSWETSRKSVKEKK
jgi:hypothetical protein